MACNSYRRDSKFLQLNKGSHHTLHKKYGRDLFSREPPLDGVSKCVQTETQPAHRLRLSSSFNVRASIGLVTRATC